MFPIVEAMTDLTAKLRSTANCTFVKADVKNMHEGLCSSLMVRQFNSATFIIANSCLMLVASLAYYFLTDRLIVYALRNKVTSFA